MNPTIFLNRYGNTPEDAIENHLERRDIEIQKPGAGEVLIKVKATTVSFVDLIMMTGQYQHMVEPPYVPGLELAGEIVDIGEGVSGYKTGDRVFSDYQKVGPRSKGNYRAVGGWTHYSTLPEDSVHCMPKNMRFGEAASFLANYETGYFALKKRANIQRGETVLITGASGAAGMASVQLANIFGAKVIVTGRTDSKLQHCLAQGADHALNSSGLTAGQLKSEIKALTDGKGVDVVLDLVGGEHGYEAFRSLTFGGRFIIVGWASNISASGGRANFEPDRLPTNLMQMKGLTVMGSPMVIYSMANSDWRAVQIKDIFAMVEKGLIKPFISKAYEFAEIQRAALAKLDGEITGSCVIHL